MKLASRIVTGAVAFAAVCTTYAGTQLYPDSGTQDYGEVSGDINQKVDLASAVSVSGAYVRCTFEGFATKPCRLQGIKPYFGGSECKTVGSTWDVIYPGATATAHEHYFLIYPGADQVELKIQSYSTVNGFKAELATEAEAKAWSDAVWAEMNVDDQIANDGSKIFDNVLKDFPIPADPFAKLPKLKAALTNGVPFTIHFLGDSIAQDTYFSLITAQLRAKFPKADLRFTLYEEGSTGCSVYANKLSTAIPYAPDLLIICGLDNFRGTGYTGDDAAAAALKTVIEYAKGLGSEVLYMTPAHSADSRLLQNSNLLYSESGTGWGAPWGDTSCTPAVFNPANNDFWTSECYHPTARNAALAEEDVPLWDIYPQCYDFVERSGRPWGWFNRDALHNNERGRALIAHLLMAYFDKAFAEEEESGGGEESGDEEETYIPEGETWTSDFLSNLATNKARRAASPYATGGDIVLHLKDAGYDDWVHVFSSTAAAAAFTPVADLHARLLMVAGGGSGGGCNGSAISGGGGAGGLIYKNDIVLANGVDYTVTVGAGGAGVSGQAGGNSGKDTTFVGGDLNFTAVHGGGGGGWYNAPKTGGSGGGGSGGQSGTVYAPAAGTQDQGNAGGAATANACGGGGGGAGEQGHVAVESPNALRRAGDGGDGLAFDITGTMEYYAGGGGAGGGSYPNRAKGGLGGGGDGATKSLTPAVSGEDGKGGGGGGIIVNGVKSGKGGDGVVIVRYCVYAGEAPLLRPCALEVTGGSVVEGSGAFAALGAGATSANATIKFTPKGGSTAPIKTYTLAEVSEGPLTADSPFTFKLTGLAYDTEYDYEISADNGSASVVAQTGTLKTYSKSLAATATGACDTISIGDLDKAFVFTGDGTFTVGGSGYAQVLVVGGGGGGGTISGGGGGGGGVYYNRALLLAPGTYAVTVGAGGSGGTSGPFSDSMSGGSPSSFVGGDGTGISISVLGGGRGARWDGGNRATDGGCGGGASGNNGNGYGTVGQGYDGGAQANSRGAGGGGATENGKSGTSTSGGAGGAGLVIDITGEMLDYGSGGGGGCDPMKGGKGSGGAAGGDGAGHGANSTVSTDDDKPSSGLDGRGGGGGGGNGTKYNGTFGGNGGSGTVIIRYTDYSLAGSKPIINITEISNIGCHSADVSINVPYAGDDADVTMTYSWGYTPEDLTLGSVTVNNFMGEVKYTVDGLSPNRPYYVVATAENSAGTVASTNSFTTVPMFSKALSLATTGGKLTYTIDGAVNAAGTDTEKLELYVGANADSLELRATYDTAELLTAGAHTVTPFTTEEYGASWTMLLRHIATDGDYAFTNETAVLVSTLQDAVTYKWNSAVADGDWTNPANWTSTGGMRGYPTVGSTADFTSTACATVHVDRVINLTQVTYSKAGAKYVFIGDTDDASVTPTARGVNGPAENQYLELDNLFFWFKHNNEFCVRSGSEIVLRNGAEMRLTKEDNLTWNLYLYMDGGKLTVSDTATFTCQDICAGKGGELIFENATHSFPKAELGARGSTPLKTVFRGAAPEFKVTGDLTMGSANANWLFEVPAAGYAAAPIQVVDFPKSGTGTNTLEVLKDESAMYRGSSKCDVSLVSANGSIDVSKVAFGEPITTAGYYYFTDSNGSSTNALGKIYRTADDVGAATIKGIWYHHLSAGFVIIVR